MQLEDTRIQPHHAAAAAMWGKGGRFYDEVSFAISDALAHAAQRLNARAGQTILDVATGTGWSARNAARAGARVTAVDISAELVAAATKAITELGWKPKYPKLEDIVATAWAWHKKHPTGYAD